MKRFVPLLILLAAAAPAPHAPAPHAPASHAPGTPAPGPVRVVGGQGAGCIAGAVRLPDDAAGLQTIRRSRSSFWGHPDTVAALLELGRRVRAAGLPDLYMGDLSGPRGGRLPGGHFSHQMGLDADVYLDVSPHPPLTAAARDSLAPPSFVRPDGRGVTGWTEAQTTLLRLATQLPGVDRVLVNAAIKRHLCDSVSGERGWLRRIRPWYGHASHMHIHFRCPADQGECHADPPPPPPGDGCDASLQWWFDQLDAPPAPPAKPAPLPPPPAACRVILGTP